MEQREILIFIIFVSITVALFIIAIVMFVILFRKKKVEQFLAHEKAETAHKQELLNTQLEIQEHTMQQIGGEIHDNVGQKLTLASLYIQQVLLENKGVKITEKVEAIGEIVNQSLIELRRLSKSLTDNVIENNSIMSLLKKEFEKIKSLKKYKVNLEFNVKELTLSYPTKSVLVRVTQEFVQNSIKHAECKTISASLTLTHNGLKYILSDDGKGFDVEGSMNKGLGLSNIRKRITLIGGKYLFESDAGGARLIIEIDL